MSYAINFTAANKAEAKQRVVDEMATVVANQPCHVKDKDAAIGTAHTFIDMLVDDDAMDVHVDMYGSVGYQWTELDPYGQSSDARFTAAGVNVSAYHVTRVATRQDEDA
ncbi:hypothetical protein [Paraburkholderia acidiphila]|uniref:Uncharacterized protein n=1 Tax=Paraburkholderia acidiphila TaxID=2571747 RepID=A0A7Z2G7N7_9BURK|nr:hypothetical protein [Paraburkholderia acidiphila]QGZ56733.1 hypothetical protein FAZ97_17365 [Paraburkholderia acidiphila]